MVSSDQEFGFDYVKWDMPIGHPSVQQKWVSSQAGSQMSLSSQESLHKNMEW